MEDKDILFFSDDIQKRVKEIADQLNRDFKDDDPLIIGVLAGAFIFCADLIRQLDFPFEFEFINAKSYLNSTVSSGQVTIRDYGFSVKGKDIIIIDDILDTGNTLFALINRFKEEGAKSITSVVLFDKPSRREQPITADIVGFPVENEYLVGYGMDDDQNRGRNFPHVFIFKME